MHQAGLRGKTAFLPGEISRWSALPTVAPATVPRSREKSAEAVVPGPYTATGKGRTLERERKVSGSTDDRRQLKLPIGNPTQEIEVKPRGPAMGLRSSAAPPPDGPDVKGEDLLEQVLSRHNLIEALSRVQENGGAPGIDGMTVQELAGYLHEHWSAIRDALYAGTYRPQPVRRVEIPKPGGKGMRLLGIPTVLDRLIQQALAQVLGQVFDPHFSDASYGFRPGRSAHQAMQVARGFVAAGYRWVVDVDLERFFDRVNHDMLMARVARRVKDKRVLKLIRAYLNAGVMLNGVVVRTEEGTPQGGPLSPLLANILLDDLDKELEKRGHRFVRYADDCNVYVSSRRAGERVMENLVRFLEGRLKLKVNEAKSAVDRPWRRKLLGFSVTNRKEKPAIRIAPEALKRAKAKLRTLTKRRKGQSLRATLDRLNAYVRGWVGYFRLAETPSVFAKLEGWLRRRLRAIVWDQWRRPRTRVRELCRHGVDPKQARIWSYSGYGAWRMAATAVVQQALDAGTLRKLGFVGPMQVYTRYGSI